jgi:CubicO group peptidase (beta-lactamase class C family)
LRTFLQRHTLARDIGERFEYSNLGTGLLGVLLASRAGADYESLVRERILAPLGMNMTGV